jgi:DNA-binding winged helix-turn-helix (wHTH) protein/tetratricopeptide (TPR) repeat protein
LRKEEPQTPEPKVFDALVFLITHRGRVVTKQELLDAVWGSQVVVTEGVVARTIMKARRLIGDDADEPAIIKTVHRVGYRFVMTVEEDPAFDPGGHFHAATRAHGPAPFLGGRIAILPFRNQTGSLDLAWFDLGLMSTTIDAVAMTPGIGVVPAADLLALVGAHEAELDLQSIAGKITRALGASDVVQAEVTRDGEGELMLNYLCTGPRLSSLRGSLTGFDPIDLCRQLAAKIVRCVSADEDSARTGKGPHAIAQVKDTQFAQIAHGRAMQAIHIERWEYARKLLQVALDIAPDDPTLRLDFARCLVWQRDPEVEPLLRQFLEEAQAANDETLELRVLHLLAVHLHRRGKVEEAERLLSSALKIAEAQQDQAAELQLLVSIADTLTNEGRVAVASWMIDRATQVASALGNQVTIAHLYDIRGRIAVFKGNEHGALEAFSEAAMLSELYGIHTSAAFSVAHMGTCLLGMGRMIDAAECFDRSFRHACESGHPVCVGLTGICVVRFGGLWRGHVTHAGAILDKLRQVSIGNSILVQGCADLAEAFLAARRGDLHASLALLERAEAEVVHTRGLAYHALRHRIRVLVCLGRLDEATALCDAMQSRAAGRLSRTVRGTALHNRGLIARADGLDGEALQLLERSVVELPPSIERADAALDAAWLHLEAGDLGRARRALSGFKPFMEAALASEYGAAMLVQARILFEEGDCIGAAAQQRRYCEMLSCPPNSGASRCLALFEQARGQKRPAHVQFPRVRALPSLFEMIPGMGTTRTLLHL